MHPSLTAMMALVFVLPMASCDRETATPPANRIVCHEEHERRFTARIVRSETIGGTSTPSRPDEWVIGISGRRFTLDDTGMAKLEAVLLGLADANRRATPPHVSELTLIIHPEPESPYEATRTLLELAGRAGIYKFSIRDALPVGPRSSGRVSEPGGKRDSRSKATGDAKTKSGLLSIRLLGRSQRLGLDEQALAFDLCPHH